jgi:hypothetical protein
MASIDGTISKRTFFYPAREGIGRGFHLAAGEPVRLIANPHTGAPIACILRNGNEYLAAVLAEDVVGGWDPAAAPYGRHGE